MIRHAWLWLIPLSLLVAAILAEGVLRVFPSLLPADAQQELLWMTMTGSNPMKSIADPYLGYVYPPFFTNEVGSSEYRFTIESDAHGFRNRYPWPDRADVVIVGDSMAYGYGVEQQDAWTTLTHDQLPGIRVVTLGMPGAVPKQYTRYFEKFGLGLRPKAVIYTIFCGNDIVEEVMFDRWLAAGSPGNYDAWRFFQGRVPSKSAALLDDSYLLLALRSARKSLTYGFNAENLTLPNGGRLRLAPNLYASTIAVNHPGSEGFDSVVRTVLEARDRARAVGSQFLVMFVPTKESIYLPLHGVPWPTLDGPLKAVLEQEEGISFIDLYEPLRDRAAQGEQLYFTIDGHPNRLGNRVIADVVTRYLTEHAQALGIDDWNQRVAQSDLARPR